MKPNPWTGISAWRELRYDLRHPVEFHRRAWAGAMGRNPRVSGEQRVLGIGLVVVGSAQFVLGVVMIVMGLMR